MEEPFGVETVEEVFESLFRVEVEVILDEAIVVGIGFGETHRQFETAGADRPDHRAEAGLTPSRFPARHHWLGRAESPRQLCLSEALSATCFPNQRTPGHEKTIAYQLYQR